MSKKYAGKKIAGSHTTLIEAAYKIVSQLDRDDRVKKLSLGLIRKARPLRGEQNFKLLPTAAGFELIIRGNIYVQTIYIYLEEQERDRIEMAKKIMKETGNKRRAT